MCIENWSEKVVLVDLCDEPEPGEELADAAEIVCLRGDIDVVVDCTSVERVGCTGRRWLLEMNDALNAHGHRMMLCGQRAKLREQLRAPGLVQTMGFAQDRFMALARLGMPLE